MAQLKIVFNKNALICIRIYMHIYLMMDFPLIGNKTCNFFLMIFEGKFISSCALICIDAYLTKEKKRGGGGRKKGKKKEGI